MVSYYPGDTESSEEEFIEQFSTIFISVKRKFKGIEHTYNNAKRICKEIIHNVNNGDLVRAIKENDIEKVKEILEIVNENLILYDKDEEGRYPFYCSIINDNINMVKIIINYANDKKFKLNIDDKGRNGWYPFLIAVYKNNITMTQIIIDYALQNNIKLNIYDKDLSGWNPLLYACNYNNTEMVELILNYSIQNETILDLNDKHIHGWYPLLFATSFNNIVMVNLILNYANKFNKDLKINEKDIYGNYPFLCAIKNNNIAMAQIIINYANQHNIKLNVKDKPLFYSVLYNNVDMAHLIIAYANEHNDIININYKNRHGYYPLLLATNKNSIKLVQLIIRYANEHNINLHYNDADMKKNIHIYRLLYNNKRRSEEPCKKVSNVHQKNQFNSQKKENIIHYQYIPINQDQSSEDPFILINAVKNNDMTTAVNTINKYTYNKFVDNVDENGWTALHWSCYYGYEEMVALLIDNKADLDIKTREGLGDDLEFKNKKAKKIAILRGHKKCADLISNCAMKRGFIKTVKYGKEVAVVIPK